jgi:hypothetical protein
MDNVYVHDLRLADEGDGQRVSVRIGDHELFLRLPAGAAPQARVEAFLPLALQEAMASGVPLVIDDAIAVSPSILEGIPRFQTILTTWNPEDLKVVPVQARPGPPAVGNGRVVSAYSGGIDSTYTYAQHRESITHLLVVQGFDGQSSEDSWTRNVNARQLFADKQGKQLVAVASNLRAYCDRMGLSWNLAHGALLGALGSVLGASRMLVPASFTYNGLFPWGSHPLLDVLWSSEFCDVEHDGCEAERVEKTRFIALQHADLLSHLQVCWRGVGENCGACPKCVRTSLALNLLGSRSPVLPPYTGPELLRHLRPSSEASLVFTEELIGLCLEKGDVATADRLRGFRRRFLAKHHFDELLKALFGRRAVALGRRLNEKKWHSARVKLKAERAWLM